MNQSESSVVKKISERIKLLDAHAEVILFGSHARGDARQDSDWDILILVNKEKSSRKIEKPYRDQLFELELEIGQPISTFVYSKESWEKDYSFTSLYQNIQQEGIRIL